MSDQPEHRCGTCRWWWELRKDEPDPPPWGRIGRCRWPTADRLPWAMREGAAHRRAVYDHEGTACPCWERTDAAS